METRRRKAGFTILEVMAVVAVLAVLSSIASVRMRTIITRARYSYAIAAVDTIGLAVSAMYIDTGIYPCSLEELKAPSIRESHGIPSRFWNGPYLPQGFSLIDPWGNPFFYYYSKGGTPLIEASEASEGDSNSASVVKPPGTIEGELLVVGLMIEKGTVLNISPSVPWQLILRTNNSTDAGMATYYRVAGASEPASYSFSFNDNTKWAIGINRVTGADTSSPVDASNGMTGTGTAVTAPSVTTSVKGTTVLCFYTNKKNANYTPDETTSKVYDIPHPTSLPSNMLAVFSHNEAGPTGNKTATATEGERWVAQQVAVRAKSNPGEGSTFLLGSYGRDGKPGGEGYDMAIVYRETR